MVTLICARGHLLRQQLQQIMALLMYMWGADMGYLINPRLSASRVKIPIICAWAERPSPSSVPVGTEMSVTDCGGAIAVAGVAGWVFRPIRIRQVSTPVTVTGTAEKTVVDSFTIPAKLMGVKGQLKIRAKINASSNNSNAKNTQMYLGGQSINAAPLNLATYLSAGYDIDLVNVSAISQLGGSGSNSAQNWGLGFQSLTVDTGVDQIFETKMQLNVSTDSITLKSLCVDIQPAM